MECTHHHSAVLTLARGRRLNSHTSSVVAVIRTEGSWLGYYPAAESGSWAGVGIMRWAATTARSG
jgi:hypothetical protein